MERNVIITSLIVILIFTAVDYISHQYLEKNYQLEKVPYAYYQNKVIFGTILLVIAVFLSKQLHLNTYPLIFAVTAFVVIGLQFNYYSTYSSKFNYIVLLLHYAILGSLLYYSKEKGYIS